MYDPGADAARRYPHIRIHRRSLGGVDAAAVPARGLIFIERALDLTGWRCAVAHELVHLDLGHDACADEALEARQERRCTAEAARRLIPLGALLDALVWSHSISEAADELRVDQQTLCARLDTLDDQERGELERRVRQIGRCA